VTTRPDKDDPSTLRLLTQAVHAGNTIDPGTGAIRTPLVLANSYALPDDPSDLSWSGTDVPLYTRNSGVNQLALQRRLAVLDNGEDAVALASGVAALHAVFFTFLKSGDHVVVANVVYEATHRLFSELLPDKYGIEATFVDTTDLDAVRAAIRPTTRLVHAETPRTPPHASQTLRHSPASPTPTVRSSPSTRRSRRRCCCVPSTSVPTSLCTR
jgi:O-acetylhomoserine/O-acetylserine sulfhydrylase-like pyridoxal-dependent enzyme